MGDLEAVAAEGSEDLAGAAGFQVEVVQVADGKIVKAIQFAEKYTSAEIRVHLSQRRFESDPLKRAWQIFKSLKMHETEARNGILLYVNLRKHQFAIVGDVSIQAKVGDHYWKDIAESLKDDLLSTHHENAIALAVKTMGITLAKYFPASPNKKNINELKDDISRD